MAGQLGSLPSVRSVMETYLSRMSRNIEDLSPKVALLMGIGERGQAHQVGMWASGQGDQFQPVDLSSKPLQNLHVFLVDPVAPEVPHFNHLKKEHPRLRQRKDCGERTSAQKAPRDLPEENKFPSHLFPPAPKRAKG